MLTLSLLRHAKSSWDDADLDDFDRPLAKRGVKGGSEVGRWIAEHGLKPDCVLCSSAVRTRATLALVAAEFGGSAPQIIFEDGLYLAAAEALIERIRAVPDGVRKLMVVGHNPGMHALALALVGKAEKADLAHLATKFPTAGLAVLTFDRGRFAEIEAATGTLEHFVSPRRLS